MSEKKSLFSRLKISRGSLEAARFLLRYMKPYRGKFVVSLVALLLSSLAGLAFPGLTGFLIDAVNHPGKGFLHSIDNLTILLIGALLLQSLFSFVRTYYLMEVAERSLADLRKELFRKLLLLPIPFFNKNRVGDLSSRLSIDVGIIQTTMTTTLSELIRQGIILIGGVTLVVYTSPRLTVVVLIAVPILVGIAVMFGRIIRKASTKVQDLYAGLNTIAEETFQGISVVKAYTAEHREAQRYNDTLGDLISISLRVARARSSFIAFIIFILFGGIVGVVWYGGHMVQSGNLSIGELTSFILYAVFVGGAMGSFADLYGSVQRALGASERVQDILLETPEPSTEHAEHGLSIAGAVRFADVHFSYPTRPDIEVLKGITLDIPAGASVALVGRSGSGKSTIISLLMRFYELNSGTITIDGADITRYPLLSYRKSLGIVPQEALLFGGTIRENIAYGLEEAGEEEIRNAAQLANALSFIESFPDSFETVVGERGVQLSGGQRQRIAIARAIIGNPSILILDEATSSLDSESEYLVQEALGRVMQGRTTVIIAHRLSTVRNADTIAVVHNGHIAESGSYSALIDQKGMFARLVALQGSLENADTIDEQLLL